MSHEHIPNRGIEVGVTQFYAGIKLSGAMWLKEIFHSALSP